MTREASDVPGSPATHAQITEFTGGMNVPSRSWRANASAGMVRLTISDRMLRMRPRFGIAAVFTAFEVPLREIACAFPVEGTAVSPAGVGFKLADGQFAYFWTRVHCARVLEVLQERGVVIDPAPHRAPALSGELGRALDRGRGAAPSLLAETPWHSPSIRRLRPLLIVLGLALGVAFVLTGWWLAVAVVALAEVQAVRAWHRNR